MRAELGKIFGSLPPEPIISYCNTGHLASTNWFVLSEVLRHPRISLYDDSMQERAQDPDRLVAS